MTAKFTLDLLRRPRRLRQSKAIRSLVQETRLHPENFIQPLFLLDGKQSETIDSMPHIQRLTLDDLLKECEIIHRLGIPGIALFPKTDERLKDEKGSFAINPENFMFNAVREIKRNIPDLAVMVDIALDPYTSHGHDGVLTDSSKEVDNDATVDILSEMAVLFADAGVDILGPSDMMDGRIREIRNRLDKHSFQNTTIMAYSAKYVSGFYGPFRDAVGSKKKNDAIGIRKDSYQINPANTSETCIEAKIDEEEGADIIMIKPALPYLDIIYQVKQNTHLPVAAYQVSGEYSQIHAAAKLGWTDLKTCRDETLIAIKRAGANIILSYFAKDFAIDIQKQI